MRHLFNRCLPLYIKLRPTTLILAIWSAPIRGIFYASKSMEPVYRHDTYWHSLRITLRSGGSYDNIIRVIKKGTI